MDSAEIRRKKAEIEKQYGTWMVHDIQLNPDIRTRQTEIEPRALSDQEKAFCHNLDDSTWAGQSSTATRIRRIIQTIADLSRKPFDQIRVLDLGAFEGGFSVELAARGATVVAVEGRPDNLAKAQFAKEVPSLGKLELVLDDVRNVSVRNYGHFDVVLCLGLLYHLNAPDVFELAREMAEMTQEILIIETEAYAFPDESFTWHTQTYWGGNRQEHDPDATDHQKARNLLMSLNNNESFVLTRFSLIKLMQHVGCSSVYECLLPYVVGYKFRVTLAGLKRGDVGNLLTAPPYDQYAEPYGEINMERIDSEVHFWYQKVRAYQEENWRLLSEAAGKPADSVFAKISRLLSRLR
jgi:SAM-dependent methyltransferase